MSYRSSRSALVCLTDLLCQRAAQRAVGKILRIRNVRDDVVYDECLLNIVDGVEAGPPRDKVVDCVGLRVAGSVRELEHRDAAAAAHMASQFDWLAVHSVCTTLAIYATRCVSRLRHRAGL
jgi:hypothetical protein